MCAGHEVHIGDVQQTQAELEQLIEAASKAHSASADPDDVFVCTTSALHSISSAQLIKYFWGNVSATILAELGPLPVMLQSPCCAEFVASKGRIQAHLKQFWSALYDWMHTVPACHVAFIFEWTWAYLMTNQTVWRPVEECKSLICEV